MPDQPKVLNLSRVTADRDRWKRLFNRLEAAVAHHRKSEKFKTEDDDALYHAHDRVLQNAATREELGL